MKNFGIAFFIFLIWSFFGLWIYSWIQDKSIASAIPEKANIVADFDNKKDSLELPIKPQVSSLVTAIADSIQIKNKNKNLPEGLKAVNPDGDIVFLYDEGMLITKNSSEIIIPEACKDYKYKIYTYLLENPETEIHITGLYSPDEDLQIPNMGILRANVIKRELQQVGISENKIVVQSMIKPIFDSIINFNNGISFSFKPLNTGRIEALKNKIPENKIIYPKFSGAGIQVNDELENVLQEIITFTAINPDLKITVIGHTDNIGNDRDNYLQGLKYARQVRWYFVAKGGIKKSNIKAISKGESEPIASNNTQKGRKANNRIEIIFN
jgi:hypothetical protein